MKHGHTERYLWLPWHTFRWSVVDMTPWPQDHILHGDACRISCFYRGRGVARDKQYIKFRDRYTHPDSKVHGANMGPTWALSDPDGPHVGPMNLAIRAPICAKAWQNKALVKLLFPTNTKIEMIFKNAEIHYFIYMNVFLLLLFVIVSNKVVIRTMIFSKLKWIQREFWISLSS